MAEDKNESSDGKKSGGMLGKLIIWGAVFAMGTGTGVAVPLVLMPSGTSSAGSPVVPENRMDIPEPDDKLAFVEFDEVVVNLNDSRYSRYLTCTFSLQVAASQKDAIDKLVEDQAVVLKNWLIAHLRDKKLEDVRGKLGQNLIRREIFDKFNELLFTDGIERIQDVLFQDFKIQ
ncbi:MAG: flagellar basal body-associated FliL family protein [Planctomycetota bacterium]